MQFTKLTLQDIDTMRPYFARVTKRTCDSTIGAAFIWRDFYRVEYAFLNDTLLLKIRIGECTVFAVPMGEDVPGALAALKESCAAEGHPLLLCSVADEELDMLRAQFGAIKITTDPAWADYVYLAEDLKTLSGRKYNGQRNHINYFRRTYPDYTCEAITPQNAGELMRFYQDSGQMDKKETGMFLYEQEKIFEILRNFEAYGMQGGFIRAGGKIVAFCIGEAVGDTYYCHIEKADTQVRGAYQMIVNETAKRAAAGVVYINREEDVGDEGLRQSKMSYHPCFMVRKHLVEILDE